MLGLPVGEWVGEQTARRIQLIRATLVDEGETVMFVVVGGAVPEPGGG